MSTSKALTLDQWKEVMNRITQHHRFGKYGHATWIKYVRPQFDMRDCTCFHIKFQYAGSYKEFSHIDEKPMFEAIMEWLDEEQKRKEKYNANKRSKNAGDGETV